MARHGRRYREAQALVNRTELLAPKEAIAKVKETAGAAFDETVELAVRLGVDPRHSDQIVRGAVVLPNGTGQETCVLVFAKGEKAAEAEEAGADFVGDAELAEKIEDGWLDFDVAVATPDMMSIVGRLGRILGPRGLMPNPKSGTVTFDIEQAVREIKAGKVEYRTDRYGNIHVPIGRVSFADEALLENFQTIIGVLAQARPAAAKGQYMRSITLSSTMGPGVKVNPVLAQKTGS